MTRRILVSLCALALLAQAHSAQAIVLSAVDSGFVTMAGGSSKGDGTIAPGATFNYSVGYELHYSTGALGMPPGTTPLAPMDRNNYFVFPLGMVSGPIVSATLLLPAGMLESVDGVEMFDVVAPVAPLMALGDAGALMGAHGMGPGAFDSPMDPAVGIASALYGNIEGGAGFLLGSKAITPADDMSVISIPPSGTPQQPFGFTSPMIPGMGPSVPKLDITVVPEPGTAVLLVVAAGAIIRGGAVSSRR
jgi:hypothetical protein